MYNRYLAAAEQTAPETSEPPQSSTFSGLGRTLNARLQGVRLDMDTMIALLIVWFLLMDDDAWWIGNSFCSPPPCSCLGCEYMKNCRTEVYAAVFIFHVE